MNIYFTHQPFGFNSLLYSVKTHSAVANKNISIRERLYRTLVICILFLTFWIPTHNAQAADTTCSGTSTVTFSNLSSTLYFPPYSGYTLYTGTATWVVTKCRFTLGGLSNQQIFMGPSGSVSGLSNLTVTTTATSGSCTTTSSAQSKKTFVLLTSANAVTMWASHQNISYGYGIDYTCTAIYNVAIATNSAGSTGGSVTALKLIEGDTSGGWFQTNTNIVGSSGAIVVGTGKALTFVARGCAATVASQTVTLPTVALSVVNTTGYTPWTTWSFGLNSCTNVSSAVTANVTFSYTELDGTGSSIIAPNETGLHVGVQVGYNGNVLATGVATSLGAMSSATSYTYTMQARYAKASGQTASAGTITGAAATYIMTYN